LVVGSFFIDGEPVRPEVALLENMNSDLPPLGFGNSQLMQGAGFAKKNKVSHVVDLDKLAEKSRPLVIAAAIIGSSGPSPKQTVAYAEIDAQATVAAGLQLVSQSGEKRGSHALQEQKHGLLFHGCVVEN
jgi:hypothetical protein